MTQIRHKSPPPVVSRFLICIFIIRYKYFVCDILDMIREYLPTFTFKLLQGMQFLNSRRASKIQNLLFVNNVFNMKTKRKIGETERLVKY